MARRFPTRDPSIAGGCSLKFQSEVELSAWAKRARPLWLFLDYDGTLADFAPTPDHIEPNKKVIDLLQRLAREPGIRLTIISGRRLNDIQTLLPVSGIFIGGTYGIELALPSGEVLHRVDYDEVRPVLDQIKPRWESIIAARQGFFLEDKGWTLALHARFAVDSEADDVLIQARQVIVSTIPADRFRILDGHKFLEIAPRLANKRETFLDLLQRLPLPGAQMLYMGDDDKDEEAFVAVQANHGVAVKVVQPSQVYQKTEADFLLASPQAANDWLESLLG